MTRVPTSVAAAWLALRVVGGDVPSGAPLAEAGCHDRLDSLCSSEGEEGPLGDTVGACESRRHKSLCGELWCHEPLGCGGESAFSDSRSCGSVWGVLRWRGSLHNTAGCLDALVSGTHWGEAASGEPGWCRAACGVLLWPEELCGVVGGLLVLCGMAGLGLADHPRCCRVLGVLQPAPRLRLLVGVVRGDGRRREASVRAALAAWASRWVKTDSRMFSTSFIRPSGRAQRQNARR